MHRGAVLACAAAGVLLASVAHADLPGTFTAQLTLTSDYVYRGISQSLEDPAVQGGFHYQHDSGFFAGVWASSVDFPNNRQRDRPRDLEADVYAGYGFELGTSWTGEARLTRYTYPGDDPSFDYDYTELGFALQYREWVSGSVYLSDDQFGRGEHATVYELAGRLPLSRRIDGHAGIGLADMDRVVGDSYLFWSVGASLVSGRFVFDLIGIDTSEEAETIFGPDITGRRVVISVTAHIE